MRTSSTTICVILLLLFAAAAVAERAERLGQVVYREGGTASIHDSEALLEQNPSLVKTLDRTAIVHLDNGQVLRLDENSAAVFEGLPSGEVDITVLSGRLTLIGSHGKLRTAGAGSRFSLGPVVTDAEAAIDRLDEAARARSRRSR